MAKQLYSFFVEIYTHLKYVKKVEEKRFFLVNENLIWVYS